MNEINEFDHLFHALLTALGFDSTLISARVKKAQGGFGPEFDHLALRIQHAKMG